MIKAPLTELKSGKAILTLDGYAELPVLITATFAELEGVFKAITRTSAGTTTLAAPTGNGGIVLTDLILTSDKVNAATVTVQWTDGVHTIAIVVAHVTDAPCNIAIPFSGHWQGWQGARLDVVTVGAVKTTVSCGYFKISENITLPYAEWDAKR